MKTLREYIEKKGLKQKYIADQLNITKQHFSKIVNGQIPSRKLAIKIEKYTSGEISAVSLLFPENEH